MLDRRVFREQMLIIENIFDNKIFRMEESELKESIISMWYKPFENMSNDLFIAGVARVVDTLKFNSVKPAHIKEACKEIMMENTITVDDAFKQINDSLRKYYHGFDEHCKLAMESYHPVVRKIVERHGGFYQLSMMEGVTYDIFKRDFEKEVTTEISNEVQNFIQTGTCLLDFNNTKLLEG